MQAMLLVFFNNPHSYLFIFVGHARLENCFSESHGFMFIIKRFSFVRHLSESERYLETFDPNFLEREPFKKLLFIKPSAAEAKHEKTAIETSFKRLFSRTCSDDKRVMCRLIYYAFDIERT